MILKKNIYHKPYANTSVSQTRPSRRYTNTIPINNFVSVYEDKVMQYHSRNPFPTILTSKNASKTSSFYCNFADECVTNLGYFGLLM